MKREGIYKKIAHWNFKINLRKHGSLLKLSFYYGCPDIIFRIYKINRFEVKKNEKTLQKNIKIGIYFFSVSGLRVNLSPIDRMSNMVLEIKIKISNTGIWYGQ